MKLAFLVFSAFLAVAYSFPQGTPAEIVVYEMETGDNSYNFKYETSDGIARSEEGSLKESGDPDDPTLLSVKGAYSFTDDQGHEHKVDYIADEKGYRVLSSS